MTAFVFCRSEPFQLYYICVILQELQEQLVEAFFTFVIRKIMNLQDISFICFGDALLLGHGNVKLIFSEIHTGYNHGHRLL